MPAPEAMERVEAREVAWEAPGPGGWRLETSHFPHPITRFYQEMLATGYNTGMRRTFRRIGLPFRLEMRFVHGRVYGCPIPEIFGGKPRNPPPAPVLWLAARLHPSLRRAARTTAAVLEARPWHEDGRRWRDEEAPEWVARNLALVDEPIADIDDSALADHVERAAATAREGILRHFELTGPSYLPIGLLLVATRAWGIAPARALELLRGASPASAETSTPLRALATMVSASGTRPTTLDDVRALGQHTAAALDDYLRLHGWRVVTGFDVDCATLVEMPSLVLASILSVTEERAASPSPEGSIGHVPTGEEDRFHELLADARAGYRNRDADAGITLNWPVGLCRRALLEAGARLAERGALADPTHVVEAEPGEVVRLLRGADQPGSDEFAARAAFRERVDVLDPPPLLGAEPRFPDTRLFPAALARVADALLACRDLMDSLPETRPLEGTGIGDTVYRGRARVARSPEEALSTLQPGEVFVTQITTPAYNAVLVVAGALVVEEGGALSHAALVARELGIPAVVGVPRALDEIPDGALVEVDPVEGRVRVLEPQAEER